MMFHMDCGGLGQPIASVLATPICGDLCEIRKHHQALILIFILSFHEFTMEDIS